MKLCPLCETVYPTGHTTCGKEGCGARLVESRQLEPGTVIREKYRILKFIGRGGMGTVYLAEHIHLNERHALKFISGELTHDPKVLKRFRQEAQALRRLIDTNIVTVYDLDQADDGAFYIAMEFVDGLGLREVISAGPLPVARAIAIAGGVAGGLAAAHAKGIIHRDIKPDNILLDHSAFHSDAIETPKLLDFGIAAVKETSTAMSRTRGFMLTPEYAAPEQWMGMTADQIDGRTDLYALGGVLYEMLTGATCLNSQTFDGWMYQHLQTGRTAPSEKRPELANWPGLDALVLSLLAKDRDLRPATAAEVVRELGKIKFVPPTPPIRSVTVLEPQVRESRKQGSTAWPWLIFLAMLLVIGAGWAVWHRTQTTPPATITPTPDLSAPPISGLQDSTGPKTPDPQPSSPDIGQLTALVEDPAGATISGTSISLREAKNDSGKTYSCVTSSAGLCSLNSLHPGHYNLLASNAPGFKPYLRNILIQARKTTRLTIVMNIGFDIPQPPQQHSEPPPHSEIDALIESGHRKDLDEDLPGAYTAYNTAENLSTKSDKYRLQEAVKGKTDALAECRDRGISCFAKP